MKIYHAYLTVFAHTGATHVWGMNSASGSTKRIYLLALRLMHNLGGGTWAKIFTKIKTVKTNQKINDAQAQYPHHELKEHMHGVSVKIK